MISAGSLFCLRIAVPFCVVLLTTFFSCAVAQTKPNVVFILADDLGWSDTTLFGTTTLYETPNIQRLADRGMTFTQAYSDSPLCSPTRASILTGLSPARHGITVPNCHLPKVNLAASTSTSANANQKATMPKPVTRLKTEYYTLAEMFQDNGYATGHFGKWHLGSEPFSPLEHGFDVDLPHHPGPGPAGSYVAPWKFKDFDHDPDVPDQHIEDRMAEEAVAFIKQHRAEPFFLNYWMFSVHAPFDAKQKLIDKYRKRIDQSDHQRSPTYAAMIESMDDAIGTLLNTLDSLGIADNTIIVFASDNGGNMYNEVDGVSATSNAPLRGGKATMYEGGIRGPAIVAYPDHIAAGSRSTEVIQSSDFYPTLLELLNVEAQPQQSFDGISFVPALKGESLNRDAVFTYFPHSPRIPDWLPPSVSVRAGDWKLIRTFFAGDGGKHDYQLFNLKNDIGERDNLADANPDRVRELDLLIESFLGDTGAVLPLPNPDFDPEKYRPDQIGKAPLKRIGRRRSAKPKPAANPKPVANPKPAAKATSAKETPSKLEMIDNGTIGVGIDANKGGAISWLSSADHPSNMVNLADAGRLIQQSYYAGKILDRKQDGQHASWSPWAWNPIQGGGVGCWAKATRCENRDGVLFSETTPKLWDMNNEDAQAVMRQWVSFEKDIDNAVVVRCQLQSLRDENDRWSSAAVRPQEVPACYFVRSFSRIETFLGKGKWERLNVRPGPPWTKVEPKLNALAMFDAQGNGVALFSPTATEHWNCGPHAQRKFDTPTSKPCMHLAPITKVLLPNRSTYEYRYWLMVGDRASLEISFAKLVALYSNERAKLSAVSNSSGTETALADEHPASNSPKIYQE